MLQDKHFFDLQELLYNSINACESNAFIFSIPISSQIRVILLFSGFGVLLVIAIGSAFKNESKKNRPEDKLQDDSH